MVEYQGRCQHFKGAGENWGITGHKILQIPNSGVRVVRKSFIFTFIKYSLCNSFFRHLFDFIPFKLL